MPAPISIADCDAAIRCARTLPRCAAPGAATPDAQVRKAAAACGSR